MDITIRKAQACDYEIIFYLIKNELSYIDLNKETFDKRMDFMKHNKQHETFVALYESAVVGFIGINRGIAYELDGEYIRIIALAVSREYQSHGIGTKLLYHVEEYAMQNSIKHFAVSSGLNRECAHKFYERNGYIKKAFSFSKELK